jgi:uncharacterized integral membrane protein (TIGR00698 family)
MSISSGPSQAKSTALWPGVLFCVGIAVVSFVTWLSYKPISSLVWAFIYSIVITNLVRLPDRLMPGTNFCAADFLRGVIAALGIVTSALIWLQVGIGVVDALVVVFFSYFFALQFGRKLGISDKLSTLIGVGTSICGASAIAATGPAIGAKEEEMGLALACITLFGLLAMFAYPFLYSYTAVGKWLESNLNAYSIWSGSGVHETAQVIAAAGALDPRAIGPALLVKSIRIFMIGPMILLATYILSRTEKREIGRPTSRVIVPIYGIVFIANSLFCAFLDAYASQVKSLGLDWPLVKAVLSGTIIPFLLATAFAGVGSKVRLGSIARLGARPLVVGAATASVAGLLALIMAILTASFVPRLP